MAAQQELDLGGNDKSIENEQYIQKIGGSETLPLTKNKTKVALDIASPESGSSQRGRLLSLDALMQLSRKRRIMYILTATLCALLLIVVLLLIAFWPDVPFYLRADLCVDKECVIASQQILLWSNISHKPCHNPYEWACGNFRKEYDQGDYFVIQKGEWNFESYKEYEELKDLNTLISMLPSFRESYSAESMISNLYESCREVESLDKSRSLMLLSQSFYDQQAFGNRKRPLAWDYRKALVHAHNVHGVHPYFKISTANRLNEPYDDIICLDMGEVGLPDHYFYNVNNNDEIVVAYKMMLRDFAINMGVVTDEAELFADEVFQYEKRIVNNIRLAISIDERRTNQIKTIHEIKDIAPSLPVFETIQAILPQIQITDDTEILVRDVDAMQEMSYIVSSSDRQHLYNFITWSVARNLLPYLSKEYRALSENFNDAIYGKTLRYPRWMICSKIVRDWLPFAVDALRENPLLITNPEEVRFMREKPSALLNKTYGNDVFLKLMFYTLKNQVETSVRETNWIDEPLKTFIVNKLASTRLQIGVPKEMLQSNSNVKEFYQGLVLYNYYFVKYLESFWSAKKLRMQEKLKPQSIENTIMLEMYSSEEEEPISYSSKLNMILIKRHHSPLNYFDYRFPIPVNFARIGVDIVEKLVEVISLFYKQFNWQLENVPLDVESDILKISSQCLTDNVSAAELSEAASNSFHTVMSSVQITARALTKFIQSVDNAEPIIGASIDPNVTYENLHLTNRRRLPGLRSLNDNELFTLAYMQKHCNTPVADKDYGRIKPHVEKKIAEKHLFNATWKHIQFLPQSTKCRASSGKCSNIL